MLTKAKLLNFVPVNKHNLEVVEINIKECISRHLSHAPRSSLTCGKYFCELKRTLYQLSPLPLLTHSHVKTAR